MRVNEIIKERRQQLGLSQKEVAQAANISREIYGSIERGTTDPKLTTLMQILIALDMELIIE